MTSSFKLPGRPPIFWATDGSTRGSQPWSTTGSPESTTGCAPAARRERGHDPGENRRQGASSAGPTRPRAPRSGSDGTAQGTALLREACPAPVTEHSPAPHPRRRYLRIRCTPGSGPVELWKSDGTPAGTRRFATPGPIFPRMPPPYCDLRSQRSERRPSYPARDRHLWGRAGVSNGTPAGTRMVADIAGRTGSSGLKDLATDGDQAYSTARIV